MSDNKHHMMVKWRGKDFSAFVTYRWMDTELDFVELYQLLWHTSPRPIFKDNYFCGFFRLHHLRRERDVQDVLSDFLEMRFYDERDLPY